MKRIIIPLILCIALCGCADGNDSPEASASADVLPEKTAPTAEPPASATEESASEVIHEPLSEQERLAQLILETRGTDPIPEFSETAYPPDSYALFPMLFGDFDGSGQDALFAVYGCESGYENAAAGEVWFACGDNAKRLDNEETPLWNIGAFRVLDEENALVAYSYIAATYRTDRIWRLSGGDVKKTEMDGFARMDFKPSEYGGFCAEHSTYDAVYGGGGRTWKEYWFRYDAENNVMLQYDAQEITEEELREYSGGAQALDDIRSDELCAVQNILLFDNGIICVNYTREYQNLFRRFKTDGGTLNDITPEENYGQYLPLSPNG